MSAYRSASLGTILSQAIKQIHEKIVEEQRARVIDLLPNSLSQINVKKCGKEKEDCKHYSDNENNFFNAASCAVDAAISPKYRRESASALLKNDSDNKQEGYDNLNNGDNGMHNH